MKRVATFIAAEAGFAVLAWVGGYDFNERGPGVALAVLWAIVAGGFLASFVKKEQQ